jgi:hypothetical protein
VRKIDRLGQVFVLKTFSERCRERRDGSDYSMKAQTRVWQAIPPNKEEKRGQSQQSVWSPFRRIRALHCGVGGLTCRFD